MLQALSSKKTNDAVPHKKEQQAAYDHCADLASSKHCLPSHTTERKTEDCALEVRAAGSLLFCNRKQELVHFVWIQVQQRLLKVQTDHSAQLTATLLLLPVNS
jgi:hypothetical protein